LRADGHGDGAAIDDDVENAHLRRSTAASATAAATRDAKCDKGEKYDARGTQSAPRERSFIEEGLHRFPGRS